jgi:hypothetical protein
MVREEMLHVKITRKTRTKNCACAAARNSRNSRIVPTVLAFIWNVNARLMCSIPCMMRLFYSQMYHQNKYHFNRVDSGLYRSINSCFFTSVFLLPEQMRSLKMKHKNFKRCDIDTQNTLWCVTECMENGDMVKPNKIQNTISDFIHQTFCMEDKTPFNVE